MRTNLLNCFALLSLHTEFCNNEFSGLLARNSTTSRLTTSSFTRWVFWFPLPVQHACTVGWFPFLNCSYIVNGCVCTCALQWNGIHPGCVLSPLGYSAGPMRPYSCIEDSWMKYGVALFPIQRPSLLFLTAKCFIFLVFGWSQFISFHTPEG